MSSPLIQNKQVSSLANYDIIERIGTGSYGLVFKAKAKNKNQLLVIKQLPITSKTTQTDKPSSQSEAQILSQLSNRYIVKYFTSFEESNSLYIVMEYCEGGDLSSYLSKMSKQISHLPEVQIWKFFIQMSLGLAYIHSKKIIHRDLKSLNIFLNKNLDVKIGDLGIAKLLQNTIHAYTFIGTPYYLSPEILEEKPYNEKSDVWALGCILYEMATFKYPYNASNQAALFLKIKNGKYEQIGNHYTHELKKMIQCLLGKNYFRRPTMKQVLEMKIFLDKAKYIGLYEATIEMINNYNNACFIDNNSNSTNDNNVSKKLNRSRQIKLIEFGSNRKVSNKNISEININNDNKKEKISVNNNNNFQHINNNKNNINNIKAKGRINNINIKSCNSKPKVNESYDYATRPKRCLMSKIKYESNKKPRNNNNNNHFHNNENEYNSNKVSNKQSKSINTSHSRIISSARHNHNNNNNEHVNKYINHKKSNSKPKPLLEFIIIDENTKEYEDDINNINNNLNYICQESGSNIHNKMNSNYINFSFQSHLNKEDKNIKGKKYCNFMNVKKYYSNQYNNIIKSTANSTKNVRHSYNSTNNNNHFKKIIYSSSTKENIEQHNKNNPKLSTIEYQYKHQQFQLPSQTETCALSEMFLVEEAGTSNRTPQNKKINFLLNSNKEKDIYNNINNNNECCHSFTDESKSQNEDEDVNSEEDEEKVSIVKTTPRAVQREEDFRKQLQKEYNDLKVKLKSYSKYINFDELLKIYSQIGNKNTKIEKTKNDIEKYIVEHIKDKNTAKNYSKLFEKWISTEIKLKNCFDN